MSVPWCIDRGEHSRLKNLRVGCVQSRRNSYREANDAIIVGELNVIRDHAVAQTEAGCCKLGRNAGIYRVVIASVGLQLVPDQCR